MQVSATCGHGHRLSPPPYDDAASSSSLRASNAHCVRRVADVKVCGKYRNIPSVIGARGLQQDCVREKGPLGGVAEYDQELGRIAEDNSDELVAVKK